AQAIAHPANAAGVPALSSGLSNEPTTRLRAPRQYRPAARAPAAPREAQSDSDDQVTHERALPIEVRLVFEKAGFCNVSLLPRRAAGMPLELAVRGSGTPLELLALQDDLYQDVTLPDIGRLLREGIEWVASHGGTAVRLSL